MRKVLRGLIVLGLVVAVGACGGDDDDDDAGSASSATSAEESSDATAVTISGSTFDPSEIETTPGETTFAVTNEDGFAHTFTVDEIGLSIEVEGGETAEGTGDLSPGDYDFRCEIHPAMTGTISVIGGL